MAPISYHLWLGPQYETSTGASTGSNLKLDHQFYIDDLKLYAKSPVDLDKQINLVKIIAH